MTNDHCTCRSGRDFDGSEFGPCPYCEREADEQRAQAALARDAARWRFTQKPGYRLNPNHEVSDVESNVVSVHLGNTWVGVGHDIESAVDCALMLTNAFGDDVPLAEVLGTWKRHYRRHWNGASWEQPRRPDFCAMFTVSAEEKDSPWKDAGGLRKALDAILAVRKVGAPFAAWQAVDMERIALNALYGATRPQPAA